MVCFHVGVEQAYQSTVCLFYKNVNEDFWTLIILMSGNPISSCILYQIIQSRLLQDTDSGFVFYLLFLKWRPLLVAKIA